jgi:hypothetical protein
LLCRNPDVDFLVASRVATFHQFGVLEEVK